jgi:hypothetical protein
MRPCGIPFVNDPEMTLLSARLPVLYQKLGGPKSVVTDSILDIDFLKSFKNDKLMIN